LIPSRFRKISASTALGAATDTVAAAAASSGRPIRAAKLGLAFGSDINFLLCGVGALSGAASHFARRALHPQELIGINSGFQLGTLDIYAFL
jgi:hypothetical protein